MSFPGLSGFLSGYLHQDWDLDASNYLEIVCQFAETERLEMVAQVIGEIEILLDGDATDADLAHRIKAMGGYYDPRPCGVGTSDWLTRAKDVMTQIARGRIA